MITLYGFGRVHKLVRGETRDLRVQWALEEIGMPYRVRALDHKSGELRSPEYSQINCFHLIPAIDDDGFVVTESAPVRSSRQISKDARVSSNGALRLYQRSNGHC